MCYIINILECIRLKILILHRLMVLIIKIFGYPKQILKNLKWHCRQYLDLNPTCYGKLVGKSKELFTVTNPGAGFGGGG